MKTFPECVPCFFSQAVKCARLASGDDSVHLKVVRKTAELVQGFSFSKSPPELTREIYAAIKDITGNPDPYLEIKNSNNRDMMSIYPILKHKVERFRDSLEGAVRIAVAGNVIDHGIQSGFDAEEEIESALESDFSMFDYKEFRDALKSKKILFLGDNAGETVLDRILIETIQENIVYAVRERPVINDALMQDARFCGIDLISRLISSGYDGPGTVLELCSEEFRETFDESDLVISKGQGNYETLIGDEGFGAGPGSGRRKKIFYMFKAKCPVVAFHTRCPEGSLILKGETYAEP